MSTLLIGLAALAAGPSPVRGWMVHGTDRAYLLSVLAAAKRYGINRLEIAGNNPTFSEEFVQYPSQTALIEEVAALGRKQGLNVYVWIREFNTRDKAFRTDPASPEGAAFWHGRQDALRAALRLMPDLRGVVVSYGSTPTEIWDVKGDAFWQAMTQPQRIRFTTERFRDVAVGEFRKDMVVRDFNHSPSQLRWLVDGLRDADGITMHSKAEPQDWQFFYPHSFSQGAYGKTPQIVEFDLTGEYWGQALVPVSLVEYLKYRWTHDRRKGARGMVGRIDRDDHRTLGSPSEINVYAHSVLMRNPEASAASIYDGWNFSRYGLQGANSARLTEIYRRGTQVAKLQYYTLGFWAPKSQTSIPESMRSVESTIRGKSTAQWAPSAKALENRLLEPDREIVDRILADKAKAIALAEKNLHAIEALQGKMRLSDYALFAAQLRFMRDQTRVWEAWSRAYWTAKLVQKKLASPEEGLAAVEALEKQAEALANPAAPRFVAMQQTLAKRLAADIRANLAVVK